MRGASMTDAGDAAIWVLADPRAGTAAQPLGIAVRLGLPFATIPLRWGPLARIPWPTKKPVSVVSPARNRATSLG